MRALRGRWRVLWLVLLLAIAGVVADRTRKRPAQLSRHPVSFEIEMPASTRFGPPIGKALAFTGDGRALVYTAGWAIYLRPIESLESRMLCGPRNALDPQPSQDGAWVAFGSDGSLCRVPMTPTSTAPPGTTRTASTMGSASPTQAAGDTSGVEILAPASVLRGLCWLPDGDILFAPSYSSGLWRLPAEGGPAAAVTTLDTTCGEVTHRWPHLLPGGEAALFTVRRSVALSYDDADVAVVRLDTGAHATLVEGGTSPQFAAPNHLFFVRAETLWVTPFDPKALRLAGRPRPWLGGVMTNPSTGAAQYSVTGAGHIAYAAAASDSSGYGLLWVDRRGREERITKKVRAIFENIALSPDERRVAMTLVRAQNDVGVLDLETGALHVMTSNPAEDTQPLWTPDGRRLVFSSSRRGPMDLYWMPAEGGPEEFLLSTGCDLVANAFTRDGRWLVYTESDPQMGTDLWELEVSSGNRRPILRTPHHERGASLSTDGRWVVFESDVSGQRQVYVMSRGAHVPPCRISIEGGSNPIWSYDGGEIFFTHDGALYAVQVRARDDHFEAAAPARLFAGALNGEVDVERSGARFLMTGGGDLLATSNVRVLLHALPPPGFP